MKIKSIYHSQKQNEDFECIIHIEDKIITKITSVEGDNFKEELENLQPSISGTKHYSFWKNTNNNYPFYLSYQSKYGGKTLYLEHSKLGLLITKLRSKIKNSYYITSFVVYSFLALLGILINVIEGEFYFSEFDILILIWCSMAVLFIWYLSSKIEQREKEIISLKKLLSNK